MQAPSELTINRSLIVVLPRQPAHDWLMRVDPEPMQITLAEMGQEQDGFLVSQTKIGLWDYSDEALEHEYWGDLPGLPAQP